MNPHPRKIWLALGNDCEIGRTIVWWTDLDSIPEEDRAGAKGYRLKGSVQADPGSVIFLEPWCQECMDALAAPRHWCEDNVWGGCDQIKKGGRECRARSIAYVQDPTLDPEREGT